MSKLTFCPAATADEQSRHSQSTAINRLTDRCAAAERRAARAPTEASSRFAELKTRQRRQSAIRNCPASKGRGLSEGNAAAFRRDKRVGPGSRQRRLAAGNIDWGGCELGKLNGARTFPYPDIEAGLERGEEGIDIAGIEITADPQVGDGGIDDLDFAVGVAVGFGDHFSQRFAVEYPLAVLPGEFLRQLVFVDVSGFDRLPVVRGAALLQHDVLLAWRLPDLCRCARVRDDFDDTFGDGDIDLLALVHAHAESGADRAHGTVAGVDDEGAGAVLRHIEMGFAAEQ